VKGVIVMMCYREALVKLTVVSATVVAGAAYRGMAPLK
jgi:hypothetical protein